MSTTGLRLFPLMLLFLTAHCLYAQQAIRTGFYKRDTTKVEVDTTARRNEKRAITCPRCNGKGYVIKEYSIGGITTKGKKKCSICNAEYLDNMHHFHVECSECHNKGYIEMNL